MEIRDLERFGFNVAEGLELCADDEDIYKEVLETALEEGEEKIPFIEELMQQKDYTRYVIEVHGLKNAAKQIGCDKLSDMSKASELAGKAGDYATVDANHDAIIEEYKRVIDAIKQLF